MVGWRTYGRQAKLDDIKGTLTLILDGQPLSQKFVALFVNLFMVFMARKE